MNSSPGDAPERLLSAALRAQAAGGATPSAPAPPQPPRQQEPPPSRLPVLRVLLFALVLGLAAGGVAAVIPVL